MDDNKNQKIVFQGDVGDHIWVKGQTTIALERAIERAFNKIYTYPIKISIKEIDYTEEDVVKFKIHAIEIKQTE